MMIHQEIQLRWYENIKKKAFVDYMNRYSGIKRIVSKWKEDGGKQKLNQIAICNNFSLFLCSKGEYELSKFSVFEQAILFASNNKVIEAIIRLPLISYCEIKICWERFRRNSVRVVKVCTI
jgi:hypothetical protein